MRFNFKLLWAFCFAVVTIASASAQKALTEGVIKYEITDITSSDEQMQMQMKMMLGSKQDIYFTQEKQMMDINMMGGLMAMKTVFGVETEESVLYMDMMGRKIMVKINPEDLEEAQDHASDMQPTVEYFKDETKEIAGYSCYKAVMTIPTGEGAGMEIVTYITDKIQAPKSVIQNIDNGNLQGVPLEYIIGDPQGMFSMVYTAQEVLNKVDASVFEIDSSKYEEMTMEEFQKSMGGMGSLGF